MSFFTSAGIALVGNTATKTTATGLWDEQVYVSPGFTGGAYAQAKVSTGGAMFGLNTDPATDASYTSIDFAILADGSPPLLYIFESGVQIGGSYGAWTPGDALAVTYSWNGVDWVIRYYHNGLVLRTVAVSAGINFFVDSSFRDSGATLTDIRFGPRRSTICWTDSVGSAALSNGLPVPMDRFSAWTPQSQPIGPEEEALGTGQVYRFTFREDHSTSFEIRGIPNTSMSLMLRLQTHLLKGGLVAVYTGDSVNSVYPTCCLVKGTKPQITQSDARELEYSMGFQLLNVAGSPVRMICQY